MEMTFLQKVAKSSCIVKCNFILGEMIKARRIMMKNDLCLANAKSSLFAYREMSCQMMEFKKMSRELQVTMQEKNSALKLLLKHCPDSVDYLFSNCVTTMCNFDQIQGRVYFDFFLFQGPEPSEAAKRSSAEFGELTILEIISTCGKERYLVHPLIETFLKLKWYKTSGLYLAIVALFAIFLVSLLGYCLTRFGSVLEVPRPPEQRDGWYWFCVVTNAIVIVVELAKIWYEFEQYFRRPKAMFKKDRGRVAATFLRRGKEVSIPILSSIVLFSDLSFDVKRNCSAILVIASCHAFMLALGRLPKIGIYIFMLNKVFYTIICFFVSYFWHFLGYAVAFHILMPKNETFGSLGNSIIKVVFVKTLQ